MNNRDELHEKLCEILGSRNVYFQPPETTKMSYPCIVYHLQDITTIRADDKPYRSVDQYSLTYISRTPDASVPKQIINSFLMADFDRWYTIDNLNHYTLSLYF